MLRSLFIAVAVFATHIGAAQAADDLVRTYADALAKLVVNDDRSPVYIPRLLRRGPQRIISTVRADYFVVGAEVMSNKRVKFTPVACLTRKTRCSLLTTQPERLYEQSRRKSQ